MDFSGQYLSFNDYKYLGGTLAKMPFNLLEFEARREINKYTSNRLVNLEEQRQEVKLCTYALIDKIKKYNETSNVSSVNTDGYSETYNKPTTSEENRERMNIIDNYLIDCKLEDGTPYLYRG